MIAFFMSDFHQNLYQIQWQTVNELKSLIHSLSENKDNAYMQRIRELEDELQRLKKTKRYGLVWEDKPEDVVEKCKFNLPVLIEDSHKRIKISESDLTHILIEWDNYHSISTLLYTHKSKIDVIYIDPPYNTWATDWIYNNDYVDKNDSYRHSKFISFIEHRLRIAKELLKEDWFFVCAIDHNELNTLWLLFDSVFWEENRLGLVTVLHNPKGRNFTRFFSANSEYMYVFSKNSDIAQFNSVAIDDDVRETFDLLESDWRRYRLESFMRARTETLRENKPDFFYPIYVSPDLQSVWLVSHDGWTKVLPVTSDGREFTWINLPETFHWKIGDDIFIAKEIDGEIQIFRKYYEQQILKNVWLDKKYQSEFNWTNILKKILWKKIFDYPKSLYLLIDILKILAKKDAIILDFFAWSGTTWHAVLELNKEDGWKRQFILCTNNENKIAEEVTYPRIRNVINGYADVEGIPANLRYYRTDFIGVDKSIDDLRGKFMGRCTDMLQVRENTFLQFPLSKNGSKAGWEWESEYFRVFQNTEKLLVVMYHPYEIETFKKWFEFLREKEAVLENSNVEVHKEIVVYIFSMGWEIFEEELAHLSDRIRIETIPDEVLETYKKIFGF